MQLTRSLHADLGIAHDGDADRMMVVDGEGRLIPGDKLLVILGRAVNARKVITTLDASMSIEEAGFSVVRTPIGDPYVSRELKRQGDFGGEPSGSWIFPEISLCPDSIYAAAQICAVAAENNLAELCRDMPPTYPIIRGNLLCAKIELGRLKEELLLLSPVAVDENDGIKLYFSDGWVLVRPSGTEPKIRVTAEARESAAARELYDTCLARIKKCARERSE
jgi:phosphoglucosamine mutase